MVSIHAANNSDISALESENARKVRELAAMGMVLLENRGGLPLRLPERRIALFGNGSRGLLQELCSSPAIFCIYPGE